MFTPHFRADSFEFQPQVQEAPSELVTQGQKRDIPSPALDLRKVTDLPPSSCAWGPGRGLDLHGLQCSYLPSEEEMIGGGWHKTAPPGKQSPKPKGTSQRGRGLTRFTEGLLKAQLLRQCSYVEETRGATQALSRPHPVGCVR